MTEETKQKICELARTGMSDKEIAKLVFYSPSYVETIRREMGCLRPCTGPKKYPVDEIRQRLRQGEKPKDIAKRYGCTTKLVYWHRQKMKREG